MKLVPIVALVAQAFLWSQSRYADVKPPIAPVASLPWSLRSRSLLATVPTGNVSLASPSVHIFEEVSRSIAFHRRHSCRADV